MLTQWPSRDIQKRYNEPGEKARRATVDEVAVNSIRSRRFSYLGKRTHLTGICPKCGQSYKGSPALSREDNKTLTCPDCGTREALATLGVSVEEQESILDAIHKHTSDVNARK